MPSHHSRTQLPSTSRTRTGALALALALALAACGDDGGGGGGTTAQPTATVAPPTTDATPTTGRATTTEPDEPVDLADVAVELTEVATAEQPVALVVRPGADTRYVVERAGTVRELTDDGLVDDPLLDISADTVAEGERGLLGAAFSPDGERVYLSYTNRDGDTRLHEWTMDGATADAATRREVLAQEQPFANHNGGHIVFGPDGLLWFGLGDGGSGGDPGDRAQDTSTLLGKILRLDPTEQGGDPYGVPGDNPFAAGGGRSEIALFGVRNPWRFSFDRETGALWVGDVGQNEIEEVTVLPAGEILGANLGWNRLEGTRPFEGEAPADAVPPVYEYDHDDGVSITGGVVYRGAAIPGLRGAYLFGDLAAGQVWALPADGAADGGEADVERVELGVGVDPGTLVSFAEDADGEVYVISIGGAISRLDPA